MGKIAPILVTGATGFTGKVLCRRLIESGGEVVSFVRPTSDIRELEPIGVKCRPVDITDRDDVLSNFTYFSRIYHVAAAYRTEHASREVFRLVNVEATRYLLEGAKRHGTGRFVHCSTAGVQGHIDDPPANEEYRTSPGDHYQESKLEGEMLARRYFSEGLPGSVVRPVGIYGPGDTRFLKLFKAIDRGMFVMIGSGDNYYHMTYVEDLVEGILLCGNKEDAAGEVFTIAGETYTTVSTLVNMIADILGKSPSRFRVPFPPVYAAAVVCEKICKTIRVNPPLYPRRVEFFQSSRAFTIEKARKILGYSPRVALGDGLRRTAAWYRENGLIGRQ